MGFVEDGAFSLTEGDGGSQIMSRTLLIVEDLQRLLRLLHFFPSIHAFFVSIGIAINRIIGTFGCSLLQLFLSAFLSLLVKSCILGVLVLEDSLSVFSKIERDFGQTLTSVSEADSCFIQDALVLAALHRLFIESLGQL